MSTPDDLAAHEARVNALLPSQYHLCAGPVSPTSMGSASLKFGPDDRVAWDRIWTSFCDLALAGGPPHRGTLLEPPTPEEVEGEPAGYQLVHEEISRGVRMTTGLAAKVDETPGWVAVRCDGEPMAAWLLRAVVAENVFARRRGDVVLLPAGPCFRIAKEIKNVVVALAKGCHYWCGHLSADEQAAAAGVMAASPLLEPAGDWAAAEAMRRAVVSETGLPVIASALGWVGVRLASEAEAAWFVRGAIAENMLARREEDVLYLPVPAEPAGPFEAVERLLRLRRVWDIARRS